LINFLIQLVVAYFFGTTFERDAYFIVSTIPNYITAIIVGSFGIMLLPKLTGYISNKGNKEFRDFLNIFFSSITILILILILFIIFFADEIVNLIANGYSDNQKDITVKLLILVIPSVFFNVFTNFLSTLYYLKNKFIYSSIAPIIGGFFNIIVVVLLTNYIGIYALPLGFLLGSIASFAFLCFKIPTRNFKIKIVFNDIDFLRYLKSCLPLLLTGLLFRTGNIFEKVIAAGLSVGSVSFLGYSGQLVSILATLISNGIAITVYPVLALAWSNNDNYTFSHYFLKAIRIIILVSLPITALSILFGKELITIVFQRGQFGLESTKAVYSSLVFMSFSIIFTSLGSVIVKVFYLTNKTLLLSILEIVGLLYYIIPAFFLSKYFGVDGMAITTSISSFISIFVSTFFCLKIVSFIKLKSIQIDIFKIVFSVFLVTIITFLFYNFLNSLSTYLILNTLLSLLLFTICYFITLKILIVSEIELLVSLFRTELNKFIRLFNN
jgi:putative peptidoglycan lipid II flippase